MRRSVTTAAVLAAVVTGSVAAATAATTTGFAQWGALTGSTNDYATTMQLPAVGFPEATVASDSRSDVAAVGSVQLVRREHPAGPAVRIEPRPGLPQPATQG